MQNLNIGQRVCVTGLSVEDCKWVGNSGTRNFKECPTRKPFYGIVCGQARRMIGKYQWHGDYCEGAGWTFKATGSIKVWEVKLGWFNKPILVPDSCIAPTKKKFRLGNKATRPGYAIV